MTLNDVMATKPDKENRLEQLVRGVVDELEYVESVLTEAESELTVVRREMKAYLRPISNERKNNLFEEDV